MQYSTSISSIINKKLKEDKDEIDKKETSNNLKTDSNLEQEEIKTIADNTLKNQTNDLKNKSASDVLIDLKNIENEYSKNDYVDAPESLGLEKVDVPNKTQEEINTLAKQSLGKKYNDKKVSTSESFAKQIDNILASKEEYKKVAENNKKEIDNIYNKSIKETENQMLKRGLARSSIVIGEIGNLEGSRAEELSNVLSNLESKLTESENKINQLQIEKEKALENLDIEYALELDEEITKTTESYQKARNEAVEFNNNIQKLEAEYKLKLDKQKQEKQAENLKLQDEYGVNNTQKIIKQKQFEYLKTYFDSLDSDYAFNLLLTNKEFKNILGNRYTEMYQYLKNK